MVAGTVGVDEAMKCIEIIRCYSIIHDLIISSNDFALQGPVVQTPVSANPGLNFNQGFFFFSSKALSQMIFYIFFRVSNHQIVDKEN